MIEPIVRKLLQRYWRLSRSLTLGVRGVVIDDERRFLLIRHTYMPGWTFPGGGVEYGETLHDALVRELDEEVAVGLTGPPELFGVYSNHVHFPGDHVAVYIVRAWRHVRIPAPNREIAEFGFFSSSELPAGITHGARTRVEEIVGKLPASMTW